MNPTEEQQREFWEWCGFTVKPLGDYRNGVFVPRHLRLLWVYPDGKEDFYPPPIDLNSLFKWAVPKFISKEAKNDLATYPIRAWNKLFRLWYEEMKTTKDPALALFRAIYTI